MNKTPRHYTSNEDFFEKYVFATTSLKDAFLESTLRRFASKVIANNFSTNSIDEIINFFSVESGKELSYYEKFNNFSTNLNDDISLFYSLPDATKLAIFNLMSEKLTSYKKHRFEELERCYDYCRENKIEYVNLDLFFSRLYDIKKLHCGETLLNGEICPNPSYDDLINLHKSLDASLSDDEKNRLIRNELSSEERYYIRQTDIKVYNNHIFRALPYSFYLEYASGKGNDICYYKISKECFAFLAEGDKRLEVIDDKQVCLNLYADFLEFVKKAKNERLRKKEASEIATLYWKSFSLFKKLPSASETDSFFKSKLTELNISLLNEVKRTEKVIVDINENSSLALPLGIELKKNIEDSLTQNGYTFISNFMSYDYTNKEKAHSLSFAGYPTDQSYFRLTEYSFQNENDSVYSIKVGMSVEEAELLLINKGFKKLGKEFKKERVCIELKGKDEIYSITISLVSEYVGNSLY